MSYRHITGSNGIEFGTMQVHAGIQLACSWYLLMQQFCNIRDVQLRSIELNSDRTGLGKRPFREGNTPTEYNTTSRCRFDIRILQAGPRWIEIHLVRSTFHVVPSN